MPRTAEPILRGPSPRGGRSFSGAAKTHARTKLQRPTAEVLSYCTYGALTMVIGLLVIGAIPTVIGVAEAISAQKQSNEANKEKIKFGLGITVTINGVSAEAQGILTDGKVSPLSAGRPSPTRRGRGLTLRVQLFLDHPESPVEGFKFDGWYFMYPGDEQIMGLVSMTCADPPALGWAFVDADTRAMRYGARKDTVDHIVGPWHWTPNEEYLTLRGGGEGFIAVREEEGSRWYVCWDPDGMLREQVGPERHAPVALRRQLKLGVESKYVK